MKSGANKGEPRGNPRKGERDLMSRCYLITPILTMPSSSNLTFYWRSGGWAFHSIPSSQNPRWGSEGHTAIAHPSHRRAPCPQRCLCPWGRERVLGSLSKCQGPFWSFHSPLLGQTKNARHLGSPHLPPGKWEYPNEGAILVQVACDWAVCPWNREWPNQVIFSQDMWSMWLASLHNLYPIKWLFQ